jgi:hypothetical protein
VRLRKEGAKARYGDIGVQSQRLEPNILLWRKLPNQRQNGSCLYH